MKRILALFAFLSCYSVYSQIVNVPVIYSVEDGFTSSSVPSGNFGNLGTMNVSKGRSIVERSFFKFNLASIPSNAVITSAILRLTPSGTENVTNSTDLYLDVCNTSWTEAGLTHASNISNNTLFATVQTSSFVTSTSKREFQVKDHVQAMVEGRLPNYGWRVRWSAETVAISTTASYYTRENATESNRPQLVIQYYLRSSVSAATIVHAGSLNSTDGSISPTVINGSNTTKTFRWYNAAGVQVGTTQNLEKVGKGWYGLKYYGDVAGDTTYQAFLIGTECENVTITFDPGPNYIDDTWMMEGVEGSGNTIINYTQSNYGSFNELKTDKWANYAPYNSRGLLRFRLWVDPNCQINTANMTLYGIEHDPNTRPNDSELLRVTSSWSEHGVAFTNAPSSTSTGKINIAGVPAGNANVTLNIASFFNLWKANNTTNYGMLLQLQSYAGSYTRMQFNSSDVPLGGSRLRPKVEFSIKATNTCDLSRKGTSVITYDATNTYADIKVTIDPPSWAVAPYHYMISEQPVPNFGDIYRHLKDSVFGGVLDSAKFFVGNNNLSKINQFSSLSHGQYYVSAFDKLGTRIYNKLVSINPINYETSSGISFLDDVFTTSAANGKAVLTSYMDEKSELASVTYTVQQITGSGEALFGLLTTSKNLNSKADIYHGFQILNNKAYLIVAGVGGTTAYSISSSDELTLVKDGTNLKFYISGVLRSTFALPASFVYKTGVFASAANTKIKFVGRKLKPFSLVLNCIDEVNPGSCLGSFGKVAGHIQIIQLGNLVSQTGFNTVLKNSSLVAQPMDAGFSHTNYRFSNLLPGNYTLTVTYNVVTNGVTNPTPVVLNYNVVVGSKVSWENKAATVENLTPANGSTLFATNTHLWGHASSVNDVNTSGMNTIVDFSTNIGSYFISTSASPPFTSLLTMVSGTVYIGFGDPSTTPLTTTVPVGFTGYCITKSIFGPFLITAITGGVVQGAPTSFIAGAKFRFVYNPIFEEGKLYNYTSANVLGSLIPNTDLDYTIPPSSNEKKLIAYIKSQNNTGFITLSTNMLCGAKPIYAKLEKQLTGVKYSVNLNKLYFFYDEEYASTSKLTYRVYDKNNVVVLNTAMQTLSNPVGNTDPVTGVIINREYGDNRYSLDATSLAAGSYVLEVINEKEEKLYLRFIR